MPGLLVLRQSAHSGSSWLAQLLRAAGVATLFQFAGYCGENDSPSLPELSQSLQAALNSTCNCNWTGRGFGESCNAARYATCRRSHYCTSECPATPSCAASAVVIGNTTAFGMLGALARSSNARVATWERCNSAKHAASQAKHACGVGSIANHRFASAAPPGAPGALLVSPRGLLARAWRQNWDRLQLAKLRSETSVACSASYEQAQLAAEQTVAALLGPLLPTRGPRRLGSTQPTVKAAPDSLDELLVGFAAVERAFAGLGCMHEQLLSRKPRCAPACELPTLERTLELLSPLPPHEAAFFARAEALVDASGGEPVVVHCNRSRPEKSAALGEVCARALGRYGSAGEAVDVCLAKPIGAVG